MKTQHLRKGILIADVLWICCALVIAVNLRYEGTGNSTELRAQLETYRYFLLAAIVFWIALYFEMNLDGFRGGMALPCYPLEDYRRHYILNDCFIGIRICY